MNEQALKSDPVDCQERIRLMRKRTGMNRKDFCTFLHIPYKTMTDWEHGSRHAPEYVLSLMEYYIQRKSKEDVL